MRNFQHQTLQRDQSSANRRQKLSSEINKNQRKVTKKSLDPAFKAVSDDDSTALESETVVENPLGESAENFIVHPADTHSSETVAISDLNSQSPSSFSVTKHAAINETFTKSPEVDSSNKTGSDEAELVIKHLREARAQALKSKDVGPSKKLLETLINVIIEEFHGGLYEEDEWLDKLLSRKSNLVILSFGMVIFAIFMFWFFYSSSMGSFTAPKGPKPT